MNTTETYLHRNPDLRVSRIEENQAFPLEKLSDLSTPAIEQHAKTYLGEYRFRLSVDDYELAFDGKLKGKYEKEALSSQAKRAIDQRRQHNETTHREEADFLGILSLEDQLHSACEGDAVLWASPPELGHKYCGEYGYIYAGRVAGRDYNSEVKGLDMFSYRIEESNLDLYNAALSRLIGRQVNMTTPEDFISAPVVLSSFGEPEIERVLFEVFGFHIPPEESGRKAQTLQMIEGHMDQFISSVQQSQPKRVQSARFDQLEWYATKVWEELGRDGVQSHATINLRHLSAERLVGFYDGSPLEVVRGSCGVSGGGGGTGLGSQDFSPPSDFFTGEKKLRCVKCPFCNHQVDAIIKNGRIHCPRESCAKSAPYKKN